MNTNKKSRARGITFLLFFLVLVTLVSFTSAVPPATTIQSFPEGYTITEINYQELKAGEDFNYFFYLYNTSNGLKIDNSTVTCNFYLTDSQGGILLEKAEVYQPNGYWTLTILGGNVSEAGYYYYGIDCSDGLGGALSGVFEVTENGKALDLQNVYVYIFLISFLVLLMFVIYFSTKEIDFDRWYNRVYSQYENKNLIKAVFSSIAYLILKNLVVVYYLIGLPIILATLEVSIIYNITNLIEIFKVLVVIYFIGIPLLSMYLFSHVQEWIVDLLEKLKDGAWGIE